MKPNKKKTQRKSRPQIKLPCPFGGNAALIDYKDANNLRKKFTTTRGRILPATKTGVSANCQRKLALSIKRARFMALIPYVHYT